MAAAQPQIADFDLDGDGKLSAREKSAYNKAMSEWRKVSKRESKDAAKMAQTESRAESRADVAEATGQVPGAAWADLGGDLLEAGAGLAQTYLSGRLGGKDNPVPGVDPATIERPRDPPPAPASSDPVQWAKDNPVPAGLGLVAVVGGLFLAFRR